MDNAPYLQQKLDSEEPTVVFGFAPPDDGYIWVDATELQDKETRWVRGTKDHRLKRIPLPPYNPSAPLLTRDET